MTTRLTYKRKPCRVVYMTTSGPRPCGQGALRGKDYCSRHRPRKRKRIEAAAPDLLEACQAAIVYDAAIALCGTDPEMAYCAATNDNLDALYSDWIGKARAAIAKAQV